MNVHIRNTLFEKFLWIPSTISLNNSSKESLIFMTRAFVMAVKAADSKVAVKSN